MKTIRWDHEKNKWLKSNRGISFEDVLWYLQNNMALDVIPNPNKKKYPNQEMLIFNIDNYIYVVPFEEQETAIFLKTIFPSRKYTRIYL